jgi:hypothetical protein
MELSPWEGKKHHMKHMKHFKQQENLRRRRLFSHLTYSKWMCQLEG